MPRRTHRCHICLEKYPKSELIHIRLGKREYIRMCKECFKLHFKMHVRGRRGL